jgi:general nucleoside transport system ATP-binding protein
MPRVRAGRYLGSRIIDNVTGTSPAAFVDPARGADILILDEPTAVLSPQESERLFAALRRLAGEGRTVLLVTHKLKEVLAVIDRVSVMRAGCIVATLDTAATDAERLAELMIGRRLPPQAKRVATVSGNPVLEVEELTGPGLHDVSFSISAGEIVEAASLDADGRRGLGIAHNPEDRLGMALIAEFTGEENFILGDQRRPSFARGWIAAPGGSTEAARQSMEERCATAG